MYSLQEVSTVSDHILDPTEYHVELFPGKDATICLQNDKRPNLTICKTRRRHRRASPRHGVPGERGGRP